MDFTGRPLRGFVFVEPRGTARPSQVAVWVGLALSFTETLPPRRPRSRRPLLFAVSAAAVPQWGTLAGADQSRQEAAAEVSPPRE
jgi:hypothetical protein